MSRSGALDPREKVALWIVAAVALLLRIAAAIEYEERHPQAEDPVIDEAAYERWALEIAGGDWLGDEVFFQEPLYPYWMASVYAVFGHERTAVRHAQAVLGALTVVLVFRIARRAFGSAEAMLAAALVAVHRPLLLMPCLLLKPNLLLPLLAGLVLWLMALLGPERRARLRPWVGVGALAAAGALLRGNVLVLLPAVVLAPLARARGGGGRARTAAAQSGLCALGVALVLLPVAARNHAVGGVFALTTSGAGTNLYGGNNPANELGVATELDWVRGIPEHEAYDWRREAERRTGRAMDPGEVSSYWMGEVFASARRDPGLHLGILWNKLRLTLGSYEVPDNHFIEWDARFVSLLRAPFPGFALLGSLGLAGALWVAARALWPGGRAAVRAGAWVLLAAFVLYLATIVLTVTSMRIRSALVPLLAPFAGHLAAAVLERLGLLARLLPWAAPAPRAPLWVLALPIACAAFVTWPVFDAEARERDLLERDLNHAGHLARAGELAEARSIALALDARYPRTSRVLTLLAETEFHLGIPAVQDPGAPPEEAEEGRELVESAFERVAAVLAARGVSERERFRAHELAGYMRLEIADLDRAEQHLRAALAFDPDDVHLRNALAEAIVRQAEREPPSPARSERLREAVAILEGVLEDVDDERARDGLEAQLEAIRRAL